MKVVPCILLFGLVACAADKGQGVAPTVPSGPTDAVPLISDALTCLDQVDLEDSPLDGSLRRLPVTGGAKCNDGSVPSVYVRAATDPAHADDWVLYLAGGGGCDSYDSCVERWCGDGAFDARWMSSMHHGDKLPAIALQSRFESNPLRGYNQVYFQYCSSDFWRGQNEDVVLTSADGSSSFRVHFQGAEIFTQALDALDLGVNQASLLDAETLVLAGSSAGGAGVWGHLDALASRYAQAQTVGVIDSFLFPGDQGLSASDAMQRQALIESYQALEDRYGMVSDASCLAAHDFVTCNDTGLLSTYIDTPYLLIHDRSDPLLTSVYGWLDGPGFGFASDALMADLRQPRPGVFLTDCGVHVQLSDPMDFYDNYGMDPAVGPISVAQAVTMFVAGEPVDALQPGGDCGAN